MPSLKELTVKNSVFLLLVAIPFAKEKNKCDRHKKRERAFKELAYTHVSSPKSSRLRIYLRIDVVFGLKARNSGKITVFQLGGRSPLGLVFGFKVFD